MYLYSFPEAGQDAPERLPDYISGMKLASEVSTVEKAHNLIVHSFGIEKWPFQCALFYSKDNRNSLLDYCREIQPDVIITEMIRTAVYYDDLQFTGALMIANLDDLLSKRYLKQIAAMNGKSGIAGIYEKRLSNIAKNVMSSSAVKRLLLRMESKRCAIWERRFYKKYDYVMMTSPLEAEVMNAASCGSASKVK